MNQPLNVLGLSMVTIFSGRYLILKKLIDPNWLPFIVTPPFPEYPAAHAYVTGAVMQATSSVLGNHVKVTDGLLCFSRMACKNL